MSLLIAAGIAVAAVVFIVRTKQAKTIRTEPWAGAKPYIMATFLGLMLEPFKQALERSDFLNKWKERVDADHWATIVERVEYLSRYEEVAMDDNYAAMQKPVTEEEVAFLSHMLNAFADNERFLIAKLSM